MVLFSRILHAKNSGEYNRRMEEARNKLPEKDQKILSDFDRNSHLYCFSKIDPAFVGLGISSTQNECLHSIFKRQQQSEKEYCVAVKNCLACLDRLISRCHRFELETMPLESIYQMPDLKAVRMVVSKAVIARIMDELGKSIQCEVADTRRNHIYIREQHGGIYQLS